MQNKVEVRSSGDGLTVMGFMAARTGMIVYFNNTHDFPIQLTSVDNNIVQGTGANGETYKNYSYYSQVLEADATQFKWPFGPECWNRESGLYVPVTTPVGLAIASRDSGNIGLTWVAVTSAEGYQVRQSGTAGAGWTALTDVVPAAKTASALTADTQYNFGVRSANIEERSAYSADVVGYTAPNRPTGLAVVAGTALFTATWPTGQNVGFRLRYASGDLNFTSLVGVTTPKTVSGLAPSVLYYVNIAGSGLNGGLPSDWSGNVTVTPS